MSEDPPREKGDPEDFFDNDEEYIHLLVSFMFKFGPYSIVLFRNYVIEFLDNFYRYMHV
jgi:hypothetical protein